MEERGSREVGKGGRVVRGGGLERGREGWRACGGVEDRRDRDRWRRDGG